MLFIIAHAMVKSKPFGASIMTTFGAVPIQYFDGFVENPDASFAALRNDLEWETRDGSPRLEYYCNDFSVPYTYGQGAGRRTYTPSAIHPAIEDIRWKLESLTKCIFEVCFLNRYPTLKNHIGWHSDDSPEMDDDRPIAIVSLGAVREIWFRPKSNWAKDGTDVLRVNLGDGSLCLMAPGMQDAYQHRIPKASYNCGERISLTFRGYVK